MTAVARRRFRGADLATCACGHYRYLHHVDLWAAGVQEWGCCACASSAEPCRGFRSERPERPGPMRRLLARASAAARRAVSGTRAAGRVASETAGGDGDEQ